MNLPDTDLGHRVTEDDSGIPVDDGGVCGSVQRTLYSIYPLNLFEQRALFSLSLF